MIFRATFLKTFIWAYNSPLGPCSFNRKLNFKKDCLILIILSHGKCYFMNFFLKLAFWLYKTMFWLVRSIENWNLIWTVSIAYLYLMGNALSCLFNFRFTIFSFVSFSSFGLYRTLFWSFRSIENWNLLKTVSISYVLSHGTCCFMPAHLLSPLLFFFFV